jgi:hypothetical protein
MNKILILCVNSNAVVMLTEGMQNFQTSAVVWVLNEAVISVVRFKFQIKSVVTVVEQHRFSNVIHCIYKSFGLSTPIATGVSRA